MTDIVERLRSENTLTGYYDPPQLQEEAASEIERLRADLLKAEMRAEIAGLENIMRAVARGRREGIEAALEIVKQWPPHMVVPNLRALLEDKP